MEPSLTRILFEGIHLNRDAVQWNPLSQEYYLMEPTLVRALVNGTHFNKDTVQGNPP